MAKYRDRGLSNPYQVSSSNSIEVLINGEKLKHIKEPICKIQTFNLQVGRGDTSDGFIVYIEDNGKVFIKNVEFIENGTAYGKKDTTEAKYLAKIQTTPPFTFKHDKKLPPSNPNEIYGFFWGWDAYDAAIGELGEGFALNIHQLADGIVFIAQSILDENVFYWSIPDNKIASNNVSGPQPTVLTIPPMEP